MTQNVPKLHLITRQHKVIELRAQGKTIETISKELGVSEKTIDRDLKSQTVAAFTDELIRQQIIDINGSDELPLRLQFRSDLLDKILPKKSEIKQDVTCNDSTADNELLKLIAEIDKRLSDDNSSRKNTEQK